MNKPLSEQITQNGETVSMRGVVSGRITLEQSDRGLANLVVEALDVTGNGPLKRLGSVCTDGQGAFQIEVSFPTARRFLRRENRCTWDLRLMVFTPERDGIDRDDRLLFCSDVRRCAAKHEHFCIELSAEALRALGIEVERAEKTAAEVIAEAHARANEIQEATDRVFESRLETVTSHRTFFRTDVLERLKHELSAVSDAERASDRFVPADDDIEPKYLEAVKTDVNTLVAKEPDPGSGALVGKVRLKSRLLLTEDQVQALTDGSNEPIALSEEEVEEKLAVALDKPPAIYRRHLEPDPCRPPTDAERCLGDVVDVPHPSDDNDEHDQGDATRGDVILSRGPADSDGNQGGNGVTFDKNTAIATQMRRQVAPEDLVEFGAEDVNLEAPLTAGGVSNAIKQVVFAPGPADVPAFYDFHDLQIAFEPVWQEALDGKYLEDVESAYDQIVVRGGASAANAITARVNAATTAEFMTVFFNGMADAGSAADSEVPASVISAVYISLDEWRALPRNSQVELETLAGDIQRLRTDLLGALKPDEFHVALESFLKGPLKVLVESALFRGQTPDTIALRMQIQLLTADAERIVAHARRLLLEREASKPFKPTHTIIEELRRRSSQAYPFRYFAASPKHRSVNFGIIVTYRQQWTPVSYQVGELVSTIPLAPKEVRKFSKKTVTKTSRARKEIESNLISRKGESEQTSRAESEIVSRAIAKTHFARSVDGTTNLGGEVSPVGGSTTTKTAFSRDAEKHSESVKKEFRESILKSAEEYKNERSLEITTEESFEEEITESGEIQNPNDEIPVTFLFYELQRRFRVAEKIHRLQSVVLVAQEIPLASAIDKAWLIRHDWILNRALLDDSFKPALTYVSTSLISDEVVLAEMRQALFRQRKLVEELKEDVADRRALAGLRYAALQRQIERTAKSAGSRGGLFGALSSIPGVGDVVDLGLDLLSPGGGPDEGAQIREGAARDAYERESREEQDLASRLLNATSALEAIQRDYNERLGQHLRQLAQCERLIAHIAQNIMYYIQVIWTYEPDDQRFLRLRDVPVPVFEKDKTQRNYVIQPSAMSAFMTIATVEARPFEVVADFGVTQPPATPPDIKTKPLSEVADLNRPLGFLGNYMIFPMLESNPITEFMMDPYVTLAEGEYGVSDPDLLGNMTLEEFADYVCCLKRHFDKQKTTPPGDDVVAPQADPFEELKPFLREVLKKLLERSLRNNEEIIVPTNSLYIEALPGAHSVMEKFKHLHRQIDVKSAQEDARQKAIDNIRRAQRILDDQLEDPDIEAKYVFEGDGTATVVSPGGGGGNA